MKRAWIRTTSLAAAFELLAGAATLWLFGSAAVSDAASIREKEGFRYSETVIYEPCCIFNAEGAGSRFTGAVLRLKNCLSACPEAQYNLIVLGNVEKAIYKLNDEYVSGEQFRFESSEESLVLADTEAGRQFPLDVRYAVMNSASDMFGSITAVSGNLGPGASTAPDAVNTLILLDQSGQAAGSMAAYCWLYNNAVETYLNDTYPGKVRAGGEALLWVSAAAFGAYWLGIALWVYLDERRLGRAAWKWGALALALNAAGLVAYIIARSQRFETGPSCAECGRPMERRWIKCPHCGQKAGEVT